MSSMYHLPAFMPSDTDVTPVPVMYSLPNYHAIPDSTVKTNGYFESQETKFIDPVKIIEQKQLDLIQSLTDLGTKLNDMLKHMGKSVCEAPSIPAEKNSNGTRISNSAKKMELNKKDKETKKEARKTAKTKAKNKVVSEGVSAPAEISISAENQWVIKEEKKSSETGQSLTACMPPTFYDFPKQDLGDISLNICSSDLNWVSLLSQIGERRLVGFKGGVCNMVQDPKTVVNVSVTDKFTLLADGVCLSYRVSVWKLLGAALGLFSSAPEHTLQAAHQHHWLTQFDLVLLGKKDISLVIREASQYLSQFDTLGSQFSIGIADIIAKALIPPTSLPNNVELWSRRLTSTIN